MFEGLACRLLTVGPDTPESRRRLDDAQAILKAGGQQVDAAVVPGQPDTVIARIVEEESVDLLVMGAYGHSRIRNLIIGSTTSEMIRACKIPVALFR